MTPTPTTHQNWWDAGPSRLTVMCVPTPPNSHVVMVGPPAVVPIKRLRQPVTWDLVEPPTLSRVYVPAWVSNGRYLLSPNTRSHYEILENPQLHSPCQDTEDGRVGKSRVSTSCGTRQTIPTAFALCCRTRQ